MSATLQSQWGDWTIGDLADVARDVADILGSGADIDMLILDKPIEDELPRARVIVRDEGDVLRLRTAMSTCGREATMIGYPSLREWTAEVAETVLTVTTDRLR